MAIDKYRYLIAAHSRGDRHNIQLFCNVTHLGASRTIMLPAVQIPHGEKLSIECVKGEIIIKQIRKPAE